MQRYPPTVNAHKDASQSRQVDSSSVGTTTPRVSTEEHRPSGNLESAQYVGLSGDYDPSLLDETNPYLATDRLRHDPVMPIHFTFHQNIPPRSDILDRFKGLVSEITKNVTSDLVSAFSQRVHIVFPLLGANSLENEGCLLSLRVSIYLLALSYCREAHELDANALGDLYTKIGEASTLKARLENIEAAVLYSQRQDKLASSGGMGFWADIGNLVGLAHDLGLNVEPDGWGISTLEKSRRRRLWWAIYIIDKWFALTLGRPSYIHEDNCNVSMLSVSDFSSTNILPENGDPACLAQLTGIEGFIAMAKLSVILAEMLKRLYTIKAVEHLRDKSADFILSVAEPVATSLASWQTASLEPLLYRPLFPDVTGSIELAYHTAKLMLCRAVYPKLHRRRSSVSEWLEQAKAVTSAVITLLESLSLARANVFWWSFSALNLTLCGIFMVSMIRLAPDLAYRDFWKSRLFHYRKILEAHSQSFHSAKSAHARLNTILRGVDLNKSQFDQSQSEIRRKSTFENHGCEDASTSKNTGTGDGLLGYFSSDDGLVDWTLYDIDIDGELTANFDIM